VSEPIFRDLESPARFVRITFSYFIVLTILEVVLLSVRAAIPSAEVHLNLESSVLQSGFWAYFYVHSGSLFVPFVRTVNEVTFLACAAGFLFWQFRAHRNLRVIGPVELIWGPWKAMVVWVIPILSLICPLLAVQELWSESRVPPIGEKPQDPNNWWIPTWWVTLLLGGPVGYFAEKAGDQIPTLESVAAQDAFFALFGALSLVSAYLAIKISGRITTLQADLVTFKERAAKATQSSSPPIGIAIPTR